MHRHGGSVLLWSVVLTLLAAPLQAIERDETLVRALEELRDAGLQLVFSSSLVDPSLRVTVDPGRGSPEEIARRILAPHGLALSPVRSGLFAIVRRETIAASSAVLEILVEQPDRTPLPGASVTLPALQRTTRADARGVARFSALEEGIYDVIVTAPGFTVGALRGLAPKDGESLRATLTLTPALQPMAEVAIYASRYQVDQQLSTGLAEISREDLEALPGLDQDVLRVTKYLPGTATNPLSARAHVRGGREDEVAIFFDDVPLFEPYHYKDVLSPFGVLDPGTISRVDFFSGVFPARYGNRLSGVLDIRPRGWSGENYHEIGASLLYSHVLTQGRLEARPIEWLGAVRRSNIDLVTDAIEWEEAEPQFLDALLRVEGRISERTSLTLGWLRLDDGLRANLSGESERGRIDYRDSTSWVAWRHRASEAANVRTVLSRTERHTDRSGFLSRAGSAEGSVDDSRRFDTTTARFEASARLSPRWRLHGGLEWYDFRAIYDYESTATFESSLAAALQRPPSIARDVLLDIEGESYAAYAGAVLSIADGTMIDVGARWDAQRYGALFRSDQVSPRLAIQHRFDPATVLRMSWGRVAQAERPDELQVQEGELRFNAAQRATHAVVSLERRVSPEALLRIEAFDKRVSNPRPVYENLFDPVVLLPELEVDRVRVHPDRSRIYGAELSLRWEPPETWAGWLIYSWSEATDRFGSASVPRTWHQRNSLSAGLSWTRRPWQLSGNLNWHSGPRRNELRVSQNGMTPSFELSSRNATSWPAFLSLDLRATWSRALPTGSLQVFAEIHNALNRTNPCCTAYRLLDDAAAGTFLQSEDSSVVPRYALFGATWRLP